MTISRIVDSTKPAKLTISPNITTLASTMSVGRHFQPASGLLCSRSERSASEGAQDDEQDAEQAREVPRAHPCSGSKRVVAADDESPRFRTR